MKLLLKFNLIFIIVMALGVAMSGWISRSMLQEQAQQEVLGGARLLMEQASAVRAYTSNQITNPRDRAVGWEVDIVNSFRADEALKEFVGQRDTPTGKSLYIARPLRITNGACLVCHSSLEAAPKTMVDKYGPANGFGWQMNEVVGAQVVSVPMALPLARAEQNFKLFIASLVGVFVVVGVVLNLMIWWVVVRPVTESFARMKTSVVQAMKMLEN